MNENECVGGGKEFDQRRSSNSSRQAFKYQSKDIQPMLIWLWLTMSDATRGGNDGWIFPPLALTMDRCTRAWLRRISLGNTRRDSVRRWAVIKRRNSFRLPISFSFFAINGPGISNRAPKSCGFFGRLGAVGWGAHEREGEEKVTLVKLAQTHPFSHDGGEKRWGATDLMATKVHFLLGEQTSPLITNVGSRRLAQTLKPSHLYVISAGLRHCNSIQTPSTDSRLW